MKKPIPFGKYLLLERINVGGMAEVFMAKAFGDEGFQRLLAIKKILPTMVEDEEFITMFLDEARISVQLNHPNIVQIHELGKQDENFYIAMDYVAGKDLRTILERYRRRHEIMPTAQAAFLATRMAEGLDYAHKRKDARGMDLNIVHRDVSPQNILVSFNGDVKIIDFGIAKAANRAQKTQAGILKGKFGYMSPEQVRGLPIDRRSDIFALGVVLFEMLTGEKLFVGESDFSTLEKVRNAEVPSPREMNSAIPPALEKIVYKSLAREVEDRYQWPGELAEDLKRILGPQGYAETQMKSFMGEAFREDVMREQQRLEGFAGVEPPPQQGGAKPAPQPAPDAVRPTSRPAQPSRAVARPSSVSAPRRTGAAPLLDPVAAALAELDGSAPQAAAQESSRPARPAPRVVTPPRPAEAADDLNGPTMFDAGADPNNPYIPPPSEEELAQMDVSADRTMMGVPMFDPNAEPSGPGKKPPLSMDTVIGPAPELAPPEHETNTDAQPPPRPAPRNSLNRMKVAPPAVEPAEEFPTRARPPDPEPEYDEPADDPVPEDEAYDDGYGEDPAPDEDYEPTGESPEDEAYEEPEPTTTESRRRNVRRQPPPEVEPAPSGGKPKIGLIVGGSALGVVVFAGLAFLIYQLVSPVPGTITVKVEPPTHEAIALIDNQQIPLDTAVPVSNGEHMVALRLPGQPEQDRRLTVTRGHPQELHFQMAPVEPPKPAPIEPTPPAPTPSSPTAAAANPGPAPTPAPVAATAPTPKAVEPAPAAAPTTFSATIDSDPSGATITVGKQKGKAPFEVTELDRKKSYTAEARLDGYKTAKHTVKFDGTDPMIVSIGLEKKPDAPEPRHEKSVTHETAPKEQKHTAPREEKHSARGSGTLVCSSNPVAKVFVDGKSTNRYTPIPPANPLTLSAGKHTIKFQSQDGKTASATVTIKANESSRLVGVTLQ